MFKKNIIRTRVMPILNDQIEAAQKAHDSEQEALNDSYASTIASLTEAHVRNKEACTDTHVATILNKLL